MYQCADGVKEKCKKKTEDKFSFTSRILRSGLGVYWILINYLKNMEVSGILRTLLE